MPNYSHYLDLVRDDEDYGQAGQSQASPVGENPAASWISRVEDPNSVVSRYGTEYSGEESPVASARGTIQRPARNVDQWGNESPAAAPEGRVTRTLNSVYRTLSNWSQYLSGKPAAEKSPYVNPQWGKENIRTLQSVMGASESRSVGMK